MNDAESYHWSPSLRVGAVVHANTRCHRGRCPTIAETLAKLGADDKTGLTDAEVQARLKKYGPNALVEKQKNAFAALLAYFWGPIPWMIEAAALMAFIVGDWGDFTIITSLLLFNALLGFWEEHEASNALDALKSSLALKARALRNGSWQQIDAANAGAGRHCSIVSRRRCSR